MGKPAATDRPRLTPLSHSFTLDFVMSFQRTQDARRMLADLRGRLAKFELNLHEEKTRLIEFGRLPALEHRQRRAAAQDVHFLGIHALLWLDPGRAFCGEAEGAEQATEGKAEVAADRS